MLLYLTIFGALCVLGWVVPKPQRGWILALLLLFLFWFMGWRYFVGCDYTGYLGRFQQIPPRASLGDALLMREPGFQFIITLVRISGLEYSWLNIICSGLIVLFLARYLFRSDHAIQELALLFPVIVLQLFMSGLRQGLAVAILVAALSEFMRGRRVLTGLYILAAAQFHVSAILFLPLAPLAGRPISTARIVVASVVMLPLAIYLMGESFNDYTDQYVAQIYGSVDAGGALPRYLAALAPALIGWFAREQLYARFPSQAPAFHIFMLLTFVMSITYFISTLATHRLTFYILPASVMIAARLPEIAETRRMRALTQAGPYVLYGAYMLGWFTLSRHANVCYVPYQNISFM